MRGEVATLSVLDWWHADGDREEELKRPVGENKSLVFWGVGWSLRGGRSAPGCWSMGLSPS